MDADDFQDLYKFLRGSRSATTVLDARALFLDNKMAEALEKLIYAREQFSESRSRLLKQDVKNQVDPKAKDAEKQIKKLQRKKDKVVDTLEAFDELIPAVEKLVDREKARQEREEAEEKASEFSAEQESSEDSSEIPMEEAVVARANDVSEEFVDAFAGSDGDERLEVINRLFGFQQVQSEDDLHGDALYFIQTSKRSLLVRTPRLEEMVETVVLVNVVDDRPIKPFTRKAFLKLGKHRKMVMLTKKQGAVSGSDHSNSDPDAEDPEEVDQSVLDMGAFSQLMTAAQRSGLVSGEDQIGHVRDREFRMGKYDLAFQAINTMYSRFTANSSQRLQRLNHEDAEIAAGRIKISPKDLQAKRVRDRSQTQEINRANRRFQVVLEGLRVLMKTH